MKISDEQLCAYLDDELTSEVRDRVERELESDPELAQRLLHFQQSDQILNRAYPLTSDKPIPKAVLDLLDTGPASLETKNTATVSSLPAFNKPYWLPLAIAASVALVVGFGLGQQLSPGASNLSLTAGVLTRDNPISELLESGPSAEPQLIQSQPLLSITPVLTFKSSTGDYCREFTALTENQGLRGLACRENNSWIIHMLVPGPSSNPDDSNYRTASTENIDAFEDYINALISESPLGADTESSLISNRWQQ